MATAAAQINAAGPPRLPQIAAAAAAEYTYAFEKGAEKTGGGDGFADVWKRGYFGWEYKGKKRDLKVAYNQLLLYREALDNPPLLVVCELDRFEVHTNFTGTAKEVHAFSLADLAADPEGWRRPPPDRRRARGG